MFLLLPHPPPPLSSLSLSLFPPSSLPSLSSPSLFLLSLLSSLRTLKRLLLNIIMVGTRKALDENLTASVRIV